MSESLPSQSSKSSTTGLQQLAALIGTERRILQEYAAKPNSNPGYVSVRDSFLLSLTAIHNMIYREQGQPAGLLFPGHWAAADLQARHLLRDTCLDGFHVTLRIGSGNRFGLIALQDYA